MANTIDYDEGIREALIVRMSIVREPDGMTPVFFCGVTLKDLLEEAIKQSLLQMTESLAKNDKQGVYMMNVRTSDGLMRQYEFHGKAASAFTRMRRGRE